MYFIIVGEDDGDAEPVWQVTSPRPQDTQSSDKVVIVGSILGGAENSDVMIEVALSEGILDSSPSQKEVQRTQEGSYNVTRNLGDDGSYNMTLDISEFYSTTGVQKTIYIRVTEGDGSRYVLNELILINLRPFLPCELDPTLSECTGSESGGINPLFIGIGGFIAILAIVGVTLVARGRGGKDSDNDAGTSNDETRSFRQDPKYF